jgi:hypothetical protein
VWLLVCDFRQVEPPRESWSLRVRHSCRWFSKSSYPWLVRRITWVVAIAACLLASCGDGGYSASASRLAETHFVALTNSLCREYKVYAREHHQTEVKQFMTHKKAEIARLHALMRLPDKPASFGAYISDLAARRRVQMAMNSGFRHGGHLPNALADLNESYRLAVKINADEKALGLVDCIGSPPRAPIGG